MFQPFRLGLSIGTDICQYARFLTPGKPNWGRFALLLQRLLTPAEVDYMSQKFPWYKPRDSEHSPADDRDEVKILSCFIAGRWAAKEAAKKAWDARMIGFRDLTVNKLDDGAVNITVSVRTKDNGILAQEGKLSISHDGDYAIATVLAETLHKDILLELQRQKAEADFKVGRRLIRKFQYE